MDARNRTQPAGPDRSRESAGFTLIEMVVALTVAGIVLLAVNPLFKVNLESYVAIQKGKRNADMARVGFGRMISELKRIQNANDVLILGTNQVQFEPAFFRNNNWYSEVIQYTYNPDTKEITRSNQTGDMVEYPLLRNVESFSIQYLDKNGAAVTSSKQIWRIRISLTVGTGTDVVSYTQDIHPKIIPFVNK